MIRLHDAIATRCDRLRTQHPESGSALLMSVLFTVFAGGVMLVLLSVLLSQLQAIQLAQKNTRTGYSAQAGIQSALSVLRSNTKLVGVGAAATTYGDPSKLPPNLTGSVDGQNGSTLRYTVKIQYFTVDPTGKSDAWLTTNALPHPVPTQPKFARLEAQGTDSGVSGLTSSVGDRTVTALYTFTTTNVNIPGGLINEKGSERCLKAERAVTGKPIRMVPKADCSDDTLSFWVYDTDYRIKLASTIGSPTVLCVTGQKWLNTTSGTDSSTVNATLQPCVAKNADAHGNQLWSWDSQSNKNSWGGQNKGNTARSGRWLGLSTAGVVEEKTALTDPFTPTPSVGAGAASIKTQQIVNYSEFGRCMDVNGENINSGYMIVYPCKQDPTGTGKDLKWNHKWSYVEPVAPSSTTAAQGITVNDGNGKRCLTAGAGNVGDVTFKTCKDNGDQRFVRNGDTGNAATSYTFQLADDRSKCLAAVKQPGQNWSRLQLVACNGSTTQKWNAPAITSGSSLGGYKELG